MWDLERGRPRVRWEHRSLYVDGVAFSPDGAIVAASCVARQVCLWSSEDGQLLRTLTGHPDYITSVAFSPDGQLLAAGGTHRDIIVWRINDGQVVQRLQMDDHPHSSGRQLAFSPDGTYLAAALVTSVRIWHVNDWKLIQRLVGDRYAESIAWSPDSKNLASADGPGVQLWRVADGELLRSWYAHRYSLNSMAWSPDGEIIATATGTRSPFFFWDDDLHINLWRASDGTFLRRLKGHKYLIVALAFSPDGKWLASGGFDGQLGLWRIK
jgi:WD40 repeat protein